MQIRLTHNAMEEVEGLYNEYPYAFHCVDISKTHIPWHWHEALEFDFVAEGSVCVSTAGQSYTFHKGEGFFVNSNVLASMEHVGSCVLHSHLFHPVFLAGHFKSVFETKYLNPVLQNKQVDIVALRGEELLRKLQELSGLQAKEDVEFLTRNLLSEIWLLLLEELKTHRDRTAAQRNPERILTMMSYIQQHYGEKLSLEDIAQAAAVSTRECLRCFRTSIRQTPMEYLNFYRMDVAKKLLSSTDYSVTDIALHTGFGSSAYFTKLFRTATGKTPLAFRKEQKRLQKPAME